jgi:phenylalanyl-tRNA synthetase beta chain
MGGQSSGVSNETTEIFIEVANWKAALVRRTSTRLGLRTDSSQRYEKSLDSQLSLRTMLRTLELILELNPTAKVVGQLEYAGVSLDQFSPLKIKSSATKIISILDYLGFKTSKLSGSFLEISVPSFRSTKDIENEQDIIEEIGRIIGYDNITPSSPLDGIAPVKLTQMQKLQRKIKNFLVHDRFFEVMTYPLVGRDLLAKYSFDKSEVLELFNSISIDHSIMRPSMIPSFLSALELNSKYQDRFKAFEIGRVYSPSANFSNESNILCIGVYDRDSNPFVDLLNSSLSLLDSIGLSSEPALPNPKFKSSVLPVDWDGIHPVEHRDFRIVGKMIASIFSVHPLLLSKLKIKGHFSFFILDLTSIADLALKDKVKYRPLNKFPSSSFDWTVTADKDQYIADIVKAAQKVKMKELDSIEVLDIFIQESKKYVTLRAVLADENGTLTTDFLKSAEASLLKATTDAGFELKK